MCRQEIQCFIKGAVCSFGGEWHMDLCLNKPNEQTPLFTWPCKLKKQTDLKGQRSFILFIWFICDIYSYWFICGGPGHLSSFEQCSGDLISLWGQLVYSVMEKINVYVWVNMYVLSLYFYLINVVNVLKMSFWISSLNLQSAPLMWNWIKQW